MSKPTQRVGVAGIRMDQWEIAFGEGYEIVRIEGTDFDTLAGCDLLVLTGGSDVNPELYGQLKHPKTNFDVERDGRDILLYEAAQAQDIPVVGVCRGAQLVNVLNGGTLIQHVNNHTNSHDIETKYGSMMQVTSTHHQMMFPALSGEVMAWGRGESILYESGADGKNNDFFVAEMQHPTKGYVQEPEVVVYEDTKCLCVQYHPEYMGSTKSEADYIPAVRYFRGCVRMILPMPKEA